MPRKIVAKGAISGGQVLVSKESEANSLYQKGHFGEMQSGGKLLLSLVEAMFLVEKGRLEVKKGRKKVGFDALLKEAEGFDPQIWLQYIVFSDLKNRGYICKTGFKFGAHFRVYEQGAVLGKDHSIFLVHCLPEFYETSMTEISRMVRLAHSVKKTLWLAIVDNEGDITYYEIVRKLP